MARVPNLKSGDPEFKFCSDHYLDLFQVVLGSTPRLHLYIANWFASPVGILNLLSLFQKVECLWTGLRAKCTSTIKKEFGIFGLESHHY